MVRASQYFTTGINDIREGGVVKEPKNHYPLGVCRTFPTK